MASGRYYADQYVKEKYKELLIGETVHFFDGQKTEREFEEHKIMTYREMQLEEAEKIKEIDATWLIRRAWRKKDGQLQLVEVNWTENELPNGLPWHISRLQETIQTGGKAFGCYDGDDLVGYATVNAEIWGRDFKYVLLDQLFISQKYRSKGIGRNLVDLCREQAQRYGADRLYICAASAEDTIAFYHAIGCVPAAEINQKLYEADTNDIPLELTIQ